MNSLKATHTLRDLGQSAWLDNMTGELLTTGNLKDYIDDLAVTGLTSNPTIFYHAIKNSPAYDESIGGPPGYRTRANGKKAADGTDGAEELFFEMALDDITGAADLFRPVWDGTDGVDGWVSLEVSPMLANDAAATLAAARALHET